MSVRWSVGWSVDWLVTRSVCHNFRKGKKLHFHAPFGELVLVSDRIPCQVGAAAVNFKLSLCTINFILSLCTIFKLSLCTMNFELSLCK